MFGNSLFAQQKQRIYIIDNICKEIENDSQCKNEITIDSSKLAFEPYVIKFYKSNKTGKLAYIQYQLLKPNVILNYFYEHDSLIKVSGIDQSTEMTFFPHLYFENGRIIYLTHRSIDGDNSGKYFLNKSKVISLLTIILKNQIVNQKTYPNRSRLYL